jgi:hypothetical protein
MDAKSTKQFPRLRRNIVSGETFIEFQSTNGITDAFDVATIAGVGEYPLSECGPRYGLLRFSSGTALTRHSYAELCDLICPDVVEDEWS